ncbi:MAG: hypothetical protein A3C62_00685 [Candidatus Zambryskibacteria bacterium RIFCSPHIGHO2_02_FULL_39_16]|uniref:LTD domain-containing protein n=1 Tax=Candidatus Zambryskibacteria bacterium RIFCSPLOWO2_02_FULL_39_14 TaxID=1802769 RepID=A0A1G2UFR3_9BACT|nr:MAG: hypothetical protein A3C62_00685 [Candidatus Zambryskibacteria bacterium RIFCSPHIGHO2_02_FULL_39_16]OHB08267.1 MAG: hypothetical protein A3I86_00865 [Candidatus Zambryskibacteria bacterium RIFCSPLOWO2_02_FULL_39_14]
MQNSNTEGVIILIVLIAIVFFLPKGSSDSTSNFFSGNKNSNSSQSNTGGTVKPDSLYAKNISISTGNASYAKQSYEEYITINNRGRENIDITNWQLINGKDQRAYDLNGSLRYFAADIAIIPKATLFISPTGFNNFQNVVLKPGEKAIITTGNIGSQLPYKIVSFKENICSGYIENLPEYKFTPALTHNCPRPANEIGVTSLDTECRKFIEKMSSCHTPKFDTRDSEGNICSNCVDGKLLSSSCVAFIKNHFNYNSCIANHVNDPNFSSKTWRIFLNKGWEMWAKEYEIIKLFDQLGRLVIEKAY